MTAGPFTALVLAGSRGAADPVAAAAGLAQKCLVPAGGVPMLCRVLDTLSASGSVGRIFVTLQEPAAIAGEPELRPGVLVQIEGIGKRFSGAYYVMSTEHSYRPGTGYRTVIESLIALHELPATRLGSDRAVGLPALPVTPRLAEAAVNQVGAARGLTPGRIVDAFDARIQHIVDHWATRVDGSRAVALGLPSPPGLNEIVGQYLDDFGERQAV